MNKVVLDSSALMAVLNEEPGAEIVEQCLGQGAFMSAVNLGELLSKVAEIGEAPENFLSYLKKQGIIDGSIIIEPLRELDAVHLAELRPLTKSAGLSLADRACLALALRLGLPVVTSDKVWTKLKLNLTIKCIR